MILVPPMAVFNRTMPVGDFFTSPMMRDPFPFGCARITFNERNSNLRADDCNEDPLIGYIERVEPEEFTRSLDAREEREQHPRR